MPKILHAVIIANGIMSDLEQARAAIQPGDLLIAADGGALNCHRLGLVPQVVIGDLDSISAAQHSQLASQNTQFIIYPPDKDQTDLELALAYAVEQGMTDILLLGLLGGRLDQTLANLLLLSRPTWAAAHLVVADGLDTATLLRSHQVLTILGKPGDTVSLIPLTLQVCGVCTEGLRWPLQSADLEFGSTWSISNEIISSDVRVIIGDGQLLVVHRMRSDV